MRILKLLAAAGLLLAASAPAHAFKLLPIEASFGPAGREATQTFQIQNDTNQPIAVEITVKARAMTPTGEDVLSDAGGDFAVYPAQAVVMPGQSQALRVHYSGPQTLDKEQAYRLIADQLPVDIGQAPADGARMRLLVRYIASLYVVPAGAKAEVSVERATVRNGPSGRELEVVVRNAGTAHKILRDAELSLEAGGSAVVLGPEALPGLNGENVLAGVSRTFVVPLSANLPEGPMGATLSVGG